MIAGRAAPELGGGPEYLDIIGCNYYYRNQWEQTHERIYFPWLEHDRDGRWVPLSTMLARVYQRYGRPMFIAETGHFGAGRADWLRGIEKESREAIRSGVPVEGVCLYPILDRNDWDNADHWHRSGLWDLEPQGDGTYRRVLNDEYAQELPRAQALAADAQS